MTKQDSALLRPAYEEACLELRDALKLGLDPKDKDKARLIMTAIGGYTRIRAVESHEASIQFSVARAMANNSAELKATVRKSLPEYVGN